MKGEEFKDDYRKALPKEVVQRLTRRSPWRATAAVLHDFAVLDHGECARRDAQLESHGALVCRRTGKGCPRQQRHDGRQPQQQSPSHDAR